MPKGKGLQTQNWCRRPALPNGKDLPNPIGAAALLKQDLPKTENKNFPINIAERQGPNKTKTCSSCGTARHCRSCLTEDLRHLPKSPASRPPSRRQVLCRMARPPAELQLLSRLAERTAVPIHDNKPSRANTPTLLACRTAHSNKIFENRKLPSTLAPNCRSAN